MSSPLVSVIMPVFNSANFIENAIISVQQQKLTEWELIVVDGGSTDNTIQIVSKLSEFDKRIRIVLNENDCGPAHARSTGINLSSGEYIAFLDGDDLWVASKLIDQITFMQKNLFAFSYTQYRVMNGNGTLVSAPLSMDNKFGFWSALFFRGIATPTVVLKRALFTDDILKTIGLSHGEDYIWWLMILRKGVTAHGLMKPLSLYRDLETSLSKKRFQHVKCVWQTYRVVLKLSLLVTTIAFISYISNVLLRRVHNKISSRFTGSLSVKSIMAQ